MTEAEWNSCTDPTVMLEFLRGKASDRKLRLFAVACCRRVCRLIQDNHCRAAVQAAEQFADGLISMEERRTAYRTAVTGERWSEFGVGWPSDYAAMAAISAVSDGTTMELAWDWYGKCIHPIGPSGAALCSAEAVAYEPARRRAAAWRERPAWQRAWLRVKRAIGVESPFAWLYSCHITKSAEYLAQTAILHDVFGNLFRPVPINPEWLAWNDSTLRKMAQLIYDDRAFDRLPLLADALEDAGCVEAELLGHLRGPGPHSRGCWAVDLLLGKE